MKTNWQDPQTSEIRSTHISGLQEAIGKIEDVLDLKLQAETAVPLTEVYISEQDRYRIYQAPAGKRNWASSPAPVIKKNGVVVSSGFTIDYGGGAIIVSPAATSTDTFTADVSYTKTADNALATHLADDVTLGEIPHIGLGGSISHATDTGEATTPHLRQVNASRYSTASEAYTQVNASLNSVASGEQSQVNASRYSTASETDTQVNASLYSTASGLLSQVNASQDSTASGARSQVNASRTTTVTREHSFTIASINSEVSGKVSGIICAGRAGGYLSEGGCKVTADNALVLVGRGVLNDVYGSIAGGLPASPNALPSPPSTAERKYHLLCTTGDLQLAGQLTSGHTFTDFAELFPNLTEQKQGYGLLQTIDGFGVRPAQEGERIIGVTTATAGIVLGDAPFSWQGRWLRDEWGAYITETIINDETGEEIEVPKENPEWNPELEQVSRLKRPDEWTVVGLVGQVYVRLKEDVQPMDFVKAWQNGIGQKSLEPTNLQVMKITQEYDAEKGYKIGFCLLK